ncbi:MAG: penicillin-binding protein [Acidobacteria bacterium]|nr:penicillin-binding protein [Acidobacteriota bacterium]
MRRAAATGRDRRAGRRGPAGRQGARGAVAEPRRARPWRLAVATAAALVAVFALLVAGIAVAYLMVAVPRPAEAVRAQSAVVVDDRGRFVGRLHAEADRVDVPLRDVPRAMRDAVVAAEDRRFYRHPGVSLAAVVRAAIADVLSGRVEQGGSTITQQYVKNAFVGRDRSLGRKLKEALLAVKLERRWTKDQILGAYLNAIYFGRGAYGVEAAARAYFGKGARSLTLAESALLAGIIRSPETLDPSSDPEAARARRDRVLDVMSALGMVGPAEAARATAVPVRVRARGAGGFAAHALEEVRRDLEARLGPAVLYRGGLRVRVALDVPMQRAAERAVASVLDRRDDPEAALVAIDPASGAVRALVGSRDFARRPFDIATGGRRQPGSAFKPFVLAAALEEGIALESRWPAPAAATFRTASGPWRVRNYDGRDHGSPDLVEATALSINTVFARLILRVGPEAVAVVARAAGIGSRLEPVPSLALGTSVVSPIDLTGAYATFAARGMRAEPHLIESVSSGARVLYRWEGRPERALDAQVAGGVTAALRAVVERGTGRRAALGRPAAGKTGTTEDHVDAWFVGYTPDLVAGVWMGYPEGRRSMERVRGIAVTGGSFPARIWRAFMIEALRGAPARDFEPEASPSPEPVSSGSEVPSP